MNDNNFTVTLRIELPEVLEKFLEEKLKAHGLDSQTNSNSQVDLPNASSSNVNVETVVNALTKGQNENAGDIYYFESLLRDEDGAYYVDLDKLSRNENNYKMVINGNQAECYLTSNKGRITAMMNNFRKYLFPLKRPASDPTPGCVVETEVPGIFVCKDNKWYMKKKITIKYN